MVSKPQTKSVAYRLRIRATTTGYSAGYGHLGKAGCMPALTGSCRSTRKSRVP